MWIALAIAMAIVAVCWFAIRRPRIPDRLEKMGPLDLVTRSTWHLDGWNNGKLSWGVVESYSVLYHGKPFSLEGQEPDTGRNVTYPRCNAFFTFPSDPPAVVVNVGDPINTSYFYLLRESPQGLSTQYIAATRVGPAAYMLDESPQESAGGDGMTTPNRHFSSGHFLLLGSYLVLDTQTAHSYPIERLDGVDPVTRPLSASPDKHSFVRIGLVAQPSSPVRHVLLDTQFLTGHVRTVPIDRTRMRYNEWQEIDESWVERHFEWQQQAGGPFQLTARANFTPLPFHGKRSYAFTGGNSTQYSLVHVKPAIFDQVVHFLSKEYPGGRQTTEPHHAEFRIEGVLLKVDLNGQDLAIWYDSSAKTSVLNQVGDRVDQFLKTGTCDNLFLPYPTDARP